jgi:hypothetical protein
MTKMGNIAAMRTARLSILPASILALGLASCTTIEDQTVLPDASTSTGGPDATTSSGNPDATEQSHMDAAQQQMGNDAAQQVGQDATTIGGQDATTSGGLDATTGMTMNIAGGNVSGSWSGQINVNGSITVQAGQTLDVAQGASINFASATSWTILGTVHLNGTAASRITISGSWTGIDVKSGGSFNAMGMTLGGCSQCIQGEAGSSITVDTSIISPGDASGSSLSLANGGTFTKTQVIGGVTVYLTGGNLQMTDSSIDLRHPGLSPDCTDWSGGGATLDHVRFTGCHCPIHINSNTLPFSATNSIFDAASVPIMIANSTATFTGNNILGPSVQMEDIGGGINANIAGNFWGVQGATTGSAPNLSGNPAQFTGANSYASAPIPGAGPR